MKSRCATDSVAYFFSVFCAGFRRCMDDACCCLMSGICCMRILRKPARLLRFFYFRSRSRAVAGPVSASLRTESRRLLRGFFTLRPDRVGSPPRRRRSFSASSCAASGIRSSSGISVSNSSSSIRFSSRSPPANPLFSVEMTVRSFGNSTMSMFLPFWFFAFRRKNDTVVAELCERKVGSAVASGICRNVPRLRPENSARRTVPGARGVNH